MEGLKASQIKALNLSICPVFGTEAGERSEWEGDYRGEMLGGRKETGNSSSIMY